MNKEPNEKKKSSNKYASKWMPIGMCLGLSVGMCLGRFIYDNMSLGMCMGIAIGMMLGMAYGASLDKKALTVTEIIEDDFGCEGIPEDAQAMVTVVVTDCESREQRIRMSDSLAYERKIEAGDTVMLAKDGTLKQMERKK